jgi:1-acyl-sn-glycerol-3-phosphate acyltransferase
MRTTHLAKYTIFDTPILCSLLHYASKFYLKMTGWRLVGQLPTVQQFIMIAAPHTSNWDLPMTLALVFAYRIRIYFLAKHTLFWLPAGIFLSWLGGVPVDRSKVNNFVEQAIELFKANKQLIMIIPPEGTRKKVRYWKSGFYHIAHGAQVPIALGFIDFRRKEAGIQGIFKPTGDFDADLPKIKDNYAGITGKNSHLTSEIDAGA